VKRLPFSQSLRTRVLLASALVQAAVLVLLIANGIHVMDAKLAERGQLHLEEQKQLLSATLEASLTRGDHAGIATLFEREKYTGCHAVIWSSTHFSAASSMRSRSATGTMTSNVVGRGCRSTSSRRTSTLCRLIDATTPLAIAPAPSSSRIASPGRTRRTRA